MPRRIQTMEEEIARREKDQEKSRIKLFKEILIAKMENKEVLHNPRHQHHKTSTVTDRLWLQLKNEIAQEGFPEKTGKYCFLTLFFSAFRFHSGRSRSIKSTLNLKT